MSTTNVNPAPKRSSSQEEIESSNKKVKSAETKAEADSLAFVAPDDWPAPDKPINLLVQDLPHDSADTEWWYVNGHLKGDDDREYSFFASFFRIVKSVKNGVTEHAHSLTWAIVDPSRQGYYFDPVLDPDTPAMLKKQLDQGKYDIDRRMNKAFTEVVAKGNVPLPDRLIKGKVRVDKDKLYVDYGGNTITKNEHGQYLVHCEHPDKQISFDLKLTPQKPAQRQGHEGVVKVGLKQETMFYYFIPRNTCAGVLRIPKDKKSREDFESKGPQVQEIKVHGSAWYDHEFGGQIKQEKYEGTNANGHASLTEGSASAQAPANSNDMAVEKKPNDGKVSNYAWNWLSMQLDCGHDITATTLVDPVTSEVYDNYAIVVGPPSDNVSRVEYLDMTLVGSESWVSIKTTNDYPLAWKLTVPGADCELDVRASFPNQEFLTLISKPAFWEGRVEISGKLYGKPVKGRGFIERHGFNNINSLDKFFKKISKEVLKTVDQIVPRDATYEQILNLITTPEFPHFMDGVNLDVYRQTIIGPLREIIDRGGKSWRSFACLLCLDAVGGNSDKYKHWLAMPELMHVGSLIVDDIQDKSITRRGGPSAHLIYGEPIAINAGTAAYFLTLHILHTMTPDLSETTRLRLYEIYLVCLRAGHAGQALDIHGLDYMMDEVVKNGPSQGPLLIKRITATHRLKSAVPAGLLARMGGTIGGGTPDQIEALGMYFESIGIAFQIVDDILNLRGFDSGGGVWKDRGEDIKAGKITFPIAMGMSSPKFTQDDRKWIWENIKSKPQDQTVVDAIIDKLNTVRALDDSHDHAEKMVSDAWNALDRYVPDSFFKMLLRAFGFYVLQRHY